MRTKISAIVVAGAMASFGAAQTFIKPPHITPPVGAMTGHPRIFLTANDVPKYRSWAKASNPIWVSLQAAADTARQRMDAHLVPDQDEGNGAGNYSPYPTEMYAELFAFMSLVDPKPSNRADWAKRAHDLIMFEFNLFGQGVGANGDPFRMPQWSVFNRSRWFGEAFPCVVDWCYDTFSPAEKATIRKVFLRWIQENLVASVTAAEHPQPLGVVNSTKLISDPLQLRWAANNYYCNHARQVGLLSMALDEVDDVPLTSADPKAGTLRYFIGNAIGAWLYQVDHNEQGATKGGMSPEGLGYGESDQSGIAMLLLGMQTAGVDDPAVYGPQAAMATGDFWSHDILDSYIHAMSPKKVTQYAWIGPSYLPADYGDVQGYRTYNYIRVWAPIALMARARGDQATYDKVRWMIQSFEPGGGSSRDYQLRSCLDSYGALFPIFYFMVFQPGEHPVDPRPNMATDFYGAGLGRVLSRTDWSATASWFTFKCSWNSTDHNPGDGNKIELYRKGEWLTKGRQGYGFNVNAADLQNTLSIQNPTNTGNWFWAIQAAHGGQFSYRSAGDPTVWHSFAPEYTYAQGDATNLYNCPVIGATDVAHASRSVMWLKPDVMVVYDRADSKSNGRAKRFYLNTEKLATVSGSSATAKTAKGQRLVVTALLPATQSLRAESVPSSVDGGETVDGEMMAYRIVDEEPSQPKSVRFLHVVQGTDSNGVPVESTYLSQTAGDAFDAAVLGSVAVAFRRDIVAEFANTTLVVPTTVQSVYVTGLKPGVKYRAKKTAVATGVKIVIQPSSGGIAADAGGVLKVQ